MCRSIKPLRNLDHPATDTEVYEAALQYVRKVSGFRKPSHLNADIFDSAVSDVALATKNLIDRMQAVKSLKSSC